MVEVLVMRTLDRPTVNRTGLKGKYDFDLVWAADESQCGGDVPKAMDEYCVTAMPWFLSASYGGRTRRYSETMKPSCR